VLLSLVVCVPRTPTASASPKGLPCSAAGIATSTFARTATTDRLRPRRSRPRLPAKPPLGLSLLAEGLSWHLRPGRGVSRNLGRARSARTRPQRSPPASPPASPPTELPRSFSTSPVSSATQRIRLATRPSAVRRRVRRRVRGLMALGARPCRIAGVTRGPPRSWVAGD
jgi:hypothetical protein